tara:strand:- start:970 stop:1221 length:252 start_codon:yes stop_codon:yes gene_type:complete
MDIFNSFDLKSEENINMIQDICRIITLQVVTQTLFVMNNNNISFFNMTFIKTVIFLCLAILIYWLIIRKLIIINFFNADKKES